MFYVMLQSACAYDLIINHSHVFLYPATQSKSKMYFNVVRREQTRSNPLFDVLFKLSVIVQVQRPWFMFWQRYSINTQLYMYWSGFLSTRLEASEWSILSPKGRMLRVPWLTPIIHHTPLCKLLWKYGVRPGPGLWLWPQYRTLPASPVM